MKLAAWGHPYSEFPEGKDSPDDFMRAFERWSGCGIERYIPFVSSRGTAYYDSSRLKVDRDLLSSIVKSAKKFGVEVHPILGLGPMGAGIEVRSYRVDTERCGIKPEDVPSWARDWTCPSWEENRADAEPDLDEMLGAIAGAGWEGVEFIGVSLDWLGTPRRLRGLLNQHGLLPVCMFGSVSLGGDADRMLERQRRIIEYAAELGCSIYCFLGGARTPLRLPTDEELRRLAGQAEILIDHAVPFGLTVAYHAHPRCTVESEVEQDRLLTYTSRLRVCVDVSVAGLMGEDAIAQLRKYRDRLGYVHMKDWARGKFCLMGQGTIGLDFGRIRETLNEIGYRGWVMGELSSYADTDAVESCYANRAYLRSVGY